MFDAASVCFQGFVYISSIRFDTCAGATLLKRWSDGTHRVYEPLDQCLDYFNSIKGSSEASMIIHEHPAHYDAASIGQTDLM